MHEVNFSLLDELLLMHTRAVAQTSSRVKETVVTVYRLGPDEFMLKSQVTPQRSDTTETHYYQGTMAQRNAKLKELNITLAAPACFSRRAMIGSSLV